MDIVIGEPAKVGLSAQFRPEGEPSSVEATLLEIRERKESTGSGRGRRGRVLTLFVPEEQKMPRGVESGEYRIYIRFVHRRQARF